MGAKQSNSRTELKDHPMLDPAAPLQVGGVDFPTYHDEYFARVREYYGVTPGFLGPFSFELKPVGNMSEGGGKGGNLIGFSNDKMFLVKELNKTDHNTLIKIADEYADHMTHHDGTLLCTVLAHFYHPERE